MCASSLRAPTGTGGAASPTAAATSSTDPRVSKFLDSFHYPRGCVKPCGLNCGCLLLQTLTVHSSNKFRAMKRILGGDESAILFPGNCYTYGHAVGVCQRARRSQEYNITRGVGHTKCSLVYITVHTKTYLVFKSMSMRSMKENPMKSPREPPTVPTIPLKSYTLYVSYTNISGVVRNTQKPSP